MFYHWKDEYIISLFNVVKDCKQRNLPIISAFKIYAEKNNKSNKSVRNYYYNQIKYFNHNPIEAKRLNIDMSFHMAKSVKRFSHEDDQRFKDVQSLVLQGYAVNNACKKVSKGDEKLTIRLQNKFRAQREKNNIITMPSSKSLSDAEINSLFLGLVKLIKKCAYQDIDKKLEREIEDANYALRESLALISAREKELRDLRASFELLKNEKVVLKEELGALRSQTANILSKKISNIKNKDLQSFINNYKTNEEKELQK